MAMRLNMSDLMSWSLVSQKNAAAKELQQRECQLRLLVLSLTALASSISAFFSRILHSHKSVIHDVNCVKTE